MSRLSKRLLLCVCVVFSDIKDMTAGSLSQRITNQLFGLKGLFQQLNEIRSYLDKVATGQLPVNHQIIYLLQVCILLPILLPILLCPVTYFDHCQVLVMPTKSVSLSSSYGRLQQQNCV